MYLVPACVLTHLESGLPLGPVSQSHQSLLLTALTSVITVLRSESEPMNVGARGSQRLDATLRPGPVWVCFAV